MRFKLKLFENLEDRHLHATRLGLRSIPHVECWHSYELLLRSLNCVILVSSFNAGALRKFQPSKNLIPEIESLMNEYQTKYSKSEIVTILGKAHKDGTIKQNKRR